MKHLAIVLTDYIIGKSVIEESERDVYEYGFQFAFETILCFIISILIAILLRMIPEGILFLILFIPLRSYAGGMHLERYIFCLLLSCLTYLGVLLINKYIDIPIFISVIGVIALTAATWFLYPAKHVNREIDETEEAYFKKRLKFLLLTDTLLCFIMLLLRYDKLISLMFFVFLLVVITMIIGKIKYYKSTSKLT